MAIWCIAKKIESLDVLRTLNRIKDHTHITMAVTEQIPKPVYQWSTVSPHIYDQYMEPDVMLEFSKKLDTLTLGYPHTREHYENNTHCYSEDKKSDTVMSYVNQFEPMVLAKNNNGLLDFFKKTFVNYTTSFLSNFYFDCWDETEKSVILSTKENDAILRHLAKRYKFRSFCTSMPEIDSYLLLYLDDQLINIYPLNASTSDCDNVDYFTRYKLIFTPKNIYLVALDTQSLTIYNHSACHTGDMIIKKFDKSNAHYGIIIKDTDNTIIVYNRDYKVNTKCKKFDYFETAGEIIDNRTKISHTQGVPECVVQHMVDIVHIL